MPAKGQSCLNCIAPCCQGIVGYQYTAEGLAKQTDRVERGETNWSTKSIMTYSHKELLNFGMIEVELPVGHQCRYQDEDGRCIREHHKFRLCRSYWCHGRLWKSRDKQI